MGIGTYPYELRQDILPLLICFLIFKNEGFYEISGSQTLVSGLFFTHKITGSQRAFVYVKYIWYYLSYCKLKLETILSIYYFILK